MAFSKILVAYDGSKGAEDALEQAIALLKDESAELGIIYVYHLLPTIAGGSKFNPIALQRNEMYETANLVISKAEEKVRSIPLTSSIIKYGDPTKVILECAEEFECDLIVMGSRGLGGILGLFMGSVSYNVVQHSRVPVLVVK